MAKKEFAENEKKKVPFSVLKKGAMCALVGATALAGGLLVGCDDDGKVPGPSGVNFYYGTEEPNTTDNPGKVGDFYIETDDGDVYQLTDEGWGEPIANVKGPKGDNGATPSISINNEGYWVINGITTNVKAEGEDGEDGDPISVEISEDGYWVIGGTKTDKKAEAEDGKTPVITISEDGYWEIDGDKTSTKAQGEKGETGEQGVSIENVTLQPYADRDGNTYVDYTFHYSNDTTTTQRVYTGATIYVGEEMTLEKALEVVAIGGTVELKADVELNKVLVVNKKVTIDLAGHYVYNETTPIWNDTEELDDWSLISVRKGGDLTIEDSGAEYEYEGEYGTESYIEYGGVIAMENDCYAIDVQEGAKCTINGSEEGTMFYGNISAVYVHTGELVVNNGGFAIQQLDPNTNDERFTLNCYNENYKNGTAKITVNGGMYLNFDPTKAGDDGDYLSDGNMAISFPTQMEENQFATVYQVIPTEYAMQMLQAIPAGMPVTATLGGDMVLPAQGIVIGDGVDLTIDLNGHTISVPNDEAGDGVFHVTTGGKLTIEGEGTIDGVGNNDYNMAIWADGGEVVINGGTFTNSSIDTEAKDYADPTHFDLIYVKNGGIVTINGGTFDCETPKWTLNSHNTLPGTIVVNGGTFKNYNPAESLTDENENNVPPTNFVAEGYTVVSETVGEDTWYTVVDLVEYIAEAEAGATITLASDVVLDAQLSIDKEITLDLHGHTISNNAVIYDEAIKSWSLISVCGEGDLTITGNGKLQAMADDCYAVDVRDGAKCVIENGTFVGNISAVYVHTGEAIINGGVFSIQQLAQNGVAPYSLTINCYNANYLNDTANITINGGSYKNYNPTAYEASEGNFVAEGYTVESTEPGLDTTDIWHTVVAEDAE